MQEIIIEINIIIGYFANGNYSKSYEALHHLCHNHQICSEYSEHALHILSRHNNLENNAIMINLDLGARELEKNELRIAFSKLINQMVKRYNPKAPSTYDEQAMRMKEQRNMLQKSLLAVEDDICDCDNEKKIEILKQIKEQLKEVIKCFVELVKNFREVKRYE